MNSMVPTIGKFAKTPVSGMSVKLWTRCLAICLGVGFLCATQPALADTIGYVLNARGKWLLDANQALHAGSPLPAGGRVHIQSFSPSDFIEIADINGSIIVRRNCISADCSAPLLLPKQEAPNVSRILQAAMAVIFRQPTRYEVLMSRGGELSECVLGSTSVGIDLTPILSDKPAGEYILDFERKTADGAGTHTGPISVHWSGDKPPIATASGLSPGLYVVQPLEKEGMKPLEPGSEAWVLITTPQAYAQATKSFADATALTTEWSNTARASTRRQFLRAVLEYLDHELN